MTLLLRFVKNVIVYRLYSCAVHGVVAEVEVGSNVVQLYFLFEVCNYREAFVVLKHNQPNVDLCNLCCNGRVVLSTEDM